MDRVAWLFSQQYEAFVGAISKPFDDSIALVLCISLVCLGLGIVLSVLRPHKGHLFAAASIFLSLGFLVLNGFAGHDVTSIISFFAFAFPVLQLACLVSLIYFSKNSRPAALAWFVFCAVYGFVTWYMGVMAFH